MLVFSSLIFFMWQLALLVSIDFEFTYLPVIIPSVSCCPLKYFQKIYWLYIPFPELKIVKIK